MQQQGEGNEQGRGSECHSYVPCGGLQWPRRLVAAAAGRGSTPAAHASDASPLKRRRPTLSVTITTGSDQEGCMCTHAGRKERRR